MKTVCMYGVWPRCVCMEGAMCTDCAHKCCGKSRHPAKKDLGVCCVQIGCAKLRNGGNLHLFRVAEKNLAGDGHSTAQHSTRSAQRSNALHCTPQNWCTLINVRCHLGSDSDGNVFACVGWVGAWVGGVWRAVGGDCVRKWWWGFSSREGIRSVTRNFPHQFEHHFRLQGWVRG